MQLTDDDRKAIARATGWSIPKFGDSLWEEGGCSRAPERWPLDAMAALDAWHARGESRTIDLTKWTKDEGSTWTIRLRDEADPSDEDGATFRGESAEFCDAACQALIAAGRESE